MDRFRAAVVQLTSGPNRDRNLDTAATLVRRAASEGARLVVLPEVVVWRGPAGSEHASTEPIPGPSTSRFGELAASLGIHLCAGSLLETSADPARPYNTSCLFGPDGTLLARYRKIHMFDVDMPGAVEVRESDMRTPGTDVVVADTTLGPIGLSVCYDLRFPELYQRQVEGGAEILTLPSAFTAPTGTAHWHVLCRARAIETQCYLLAANQTGASPYGFDDYGHSMIVDPWGTVLAEVTEGEGIAVAEIDRTEIRRVRGVLPALAGNRLRTR